MKTPVHHLVLPVCLILSSPVFSAIDPGQYPEKVKLSVAEILSLPGENRLAVAQGRKSELAKPLEETIFNRNAEFGLRWKAVMLLAQLEKAKAIGVLDKALQSKEWFLRNAALLAYADAAPERASSIAAKMLEDKALVIRSAAVDVLSRNLDSQTREVLWNEIDQPHNFRKKQSLWIRPQILKALAESPQPRELSLFLSHLREKDERMHSHAIRALERVTNEIRGKSITPLAEKRGLWLKWAQASKAEGTL